LDRLIDVHQKRLQDVTLKRCRGLVIGTGRFAKIRGILVDVAKFDTDPKVGYNVSDSRGEYWFEQ